MAKSKKRKHHEFVTAQRDSALSSVGSILNDSRLNARDAASSSERIEDQSHSIDTPLSTEEDWQTVSYKSGPQKQRGNHAQDSSKYPELLFHAKRNVPITIADLQQLILYTLADGVAPNWVALKHGHQIVKVVVLMIPGLEKEMFQQSFDPDKPFEGMNVDQHDKGNMNGSDSKNEVEVKLKQAQNNQARRRNEFEAWKTGQNLQGHHPSIITPISIDASELVPSLQPLADIFDRVWPIRAPGDTKYSRVHSPLQATLLSPLPTSKDQGQHNLKVFAEAFKPVRTPISYFIHSADELREAEYPVHPAAFTSAADADLEKERRQKTNQSSISGWVDTDVHTTLPVMPSTHKKQSDEPHQGLQIYAIDCEMVLTRDDVYSLARVSILDWNGKVVVDKYVKPSLPIKNYYTQYSGITPEILENVTTTLPEIQTELLTLFTPSTILLGHSLESDLNALKLTHPFIIDTALIYPHPRGPPLRSSLRYLTTKYLKREIQSAGAKGHNSLEDALAVLDLVKLKCEKGPKWGTTETHGEPIFRRLARQNGRDSQPRTSAIIDYGSPGKGYGREATYSIGCKNDQEIADGVVRAVKGDPDAQEIKAGGADFIWARLRELESFRGWCNNNREYGTVDELHGGNKIEIQNTEDKTEGPEIEPATQHPRAATLTSLLSSTVSHIQTIHAALPPCTLFIVYSGTGDPRELARLQRVQSQFKKEFKVKKWDELSVKWTDTEEQALKREVERVRSGCGFLRVV